MIKNELKKKLGLYSLASGAMALAANNAEAQITYTDITPDKTVNALGSAGSYMLDLNGDGTNDFEIIINGNGSTNFKQLYINPVGAGNEILSTHPSAQYKGEALALGAAIPITPTTQVWGASAMLVGSSSSGGYGNFKNVTDKYIGLRLRSGTVGNYTYTYGWVRVSATYTAPGTGLPTTVAHQGTISITLKDKAYNATTGATLTAGQSATTAVQQSQDLTSNTQVFVNGQNEVSVINNTETDLSTQLLDINGNLIATKDATNGLTLLSSSNLAPGMYIVRMMSGGAIASKKVFIR